ncbi:MAG: hypothetical protein HY703_02495 [Gemmatimonadetes bacterium]|nr:hypothetical protein [Gemmatimonadota bacterium]
MFPRWMKCSLPALTLALAVASCDRGQPSIDELVGPQFNTTGNGYSKVKGDDGDGSSLALTVDGAGGEIQMGKHWLRIPRGAVSEPTVFVMTLLEAEYLTVDLTATSVGSIVLNDVGAAGFAVAVDLRLSYEYASQSIADESKLFIAWIRPDGTLEAQPSKVDGSSKHVSADLWHFSGYTVADGVCLLETGC